MKIIDITNLYTPYVKGGAELGTQALVEELAGMGHNLSVITSAPANREKELSLDTVNNIPVYRIHSKRSYWILDQPPNISGISKAIWHLQDAWDVRTGRLLDELIERISPDVVLTHNIDALSPIVWAIPKKKGIPVVHTAHDLHLLCPRTTMLHRDGRSCIKPHPVCIIYETWYRRRVKDLAVLCCPSQYILDYHKSFGFTPPEYRLIRNGVPELINYQSDRTMLQKNGMIKFLFLGRLAKIKGVETLLKAIEIMGPQYQRMEFHFAGNGDLKESVEEAAKRSPNVFFHGFVSGTEKEKLLKNSDVLLISSECSENAPLSILEARQYGLAVVGSEIGGIPELIQDSVDGKLVCPGQADRWAVSLLELAENHETLNSMKAASLRLRKKSGIKRRASEYLSLLNSIVYAGNHK